MSNRADQEIQEQNPNYPIPEIHVVHHGRSARKSLEQRQGLGVSKDSPPPRLEQENKWVVWPSPHSPAIAVKPPELQG